MKKPGVVTATGIGTVRLATAAEEAETAKVDKKDVFAKAKTAHAKAQQAYAEAEINFTGMKHGEKVDPEALAKAREHAEECWKGVSDSKKAAVMAEADMYDDDDDSDDDDSEGSAKAAEATASVATADEDEAAKAAEAAEKKKAADEAEAASIAKAAEDKKKADDEAEAAKAAEATASVATASTLIVESESEKMYKAKLAEMEVANADLQSKLAVATAAKVVETAVAETARPAAEIATGRTNSSAIARATISFDREKGAKVVVLSAKAPNGEGIATAAAKATGGMMDMSELFKRTK